MAKAYTKDFLVQAYAYRFYALGQDRYDERYACASKFYDKVGKETFRTYACLDAEAIKDFMKELEKY